MAKQNSNDPELRRQIDREIRRIDRLAALQSEAEQRLLSLTDELRRIAPAPPAERGPTSNESVRSNQEKIDLFRSLFRGRSDVFPRHWRNARTGSQGYSPSCGNEWLAGVCEKPRVKCGECPHQAFLPVSDKVVLDHLQGRHVIGLYPLFPDNTCWLLAVDFDDGEWQADVAAFRDTCVDVGVHPAIERSRSGNGGHAWFFFSAPIPASVARRFATQLLTETMSRRHGLSLKSYDRLFPNQDTMPRGGFGNLIALPLQHEARRSGNTVFVDRDGIPHADQWKYLDSISRVTPETAAAIAGEAAENRDGIGLPGLDDFDDDARKPWIPRSRSRAAILKTRLAETRPAHIHAVLAGRIFIEKAGVPSPLLNAIKRLAAFQNPDFYQKQSLRLSTARTPRVIGCAEDLPRHLALPRGCLAPLSDLVHSLDIDLDVSDERCSGELLDLEFHGELDPGQQTASDRVLPHDIGIMVAPPGSGKTVVGIHLIAQRSRSTLVLVHRTPLLEQWRQQISSFLGIPIREIGAVGAGKRRVTGRIDVAMIQSLARQDDAAEQLGRYGHVIVDECHHVPAVSFERVMNAVSARFVTGLTATPKRRDGHHPILHFQLGPIRCTASAGARSSLRAPVRSLKVRRTDFRIDESDGRVVIQEIYSRLAADPNRNRAIVDEVVAALERGRFPLVLTERRDHLEHLAEGLRAAGETVVVLRGGMTVRERRGEEDRLLDMAIAHRRVVLATGRFAGEGFDNARLDTLFLTMPISWEGTVVQYAGRLHRSHRDKTNLLIVDYLDSDVPVLARMFQKRLRTYAALGYSVEHP